MTIPLYKWPDAVDFHFLISEVERIHGINVRDYAGRYSKKAIDEEKEARDKWLVENGYEGKAYVLDKPDGSREDWPKDSEEMRLRIEINTKMRDWESPRNKIPYQDFWHYALDQFGELHRGGVNYLCLNAEGQEWHNEILGYIKELVKDSPAYDGEYLALFIDW